MTDSVRDQYEAYPYPARDPRDETKRLITGSPSNLAEINHYLFGGARDFTAPFKALVAGGGTGDAAIMLAQQLADASHQGSVAYLDLSDASRAIAKARAEARGLTNIQFHRGSLLELSELGLGPFDYIDCCGVLHHLADPPAGLRALERVLGDGGGLGMMLYGSLGRRGVYETQALLREIAGDRPLAEQVELARRLLDKLPPSNWLTRNPFLGDHKKSDAELVDLLLHRQDRAYSVEEIIDLAESAGLKPAAFIEPARYDPDSYLKDPKLLAPLSKLSWLERAAAAEKLAGNMKTHVFYLSRSGPASVAQPESPDAIPLLRELEGPALARAVQGDLILKADFGGLPQRFPLPRLAPAMLQRIDGTSTLGELHQTLREFDSALDWTAFKKQFDQLYGALNGINRLLLKTSRGNR